MYVCTYVYTCTIYMYNIICVKKHYVLKYNVHVRTCMCVCIDV